MSIRLITGVERGEVSAGVGACADPDVCVPVGEADGVTDEAVPVWEQDARTRATPRPTAAVRYLCQRVVFLTTGSLGTFV
jgi:hypothetical protein